MSDPKTAALEAVDRYFASLCNLEGPDDRTGSFLTQDTRALWRQVRAALAEPADPDPNIAPPDAMRCRELEKAIRLVLPMAEFYATHNPIQNSSEWVAIRNAKAILNGELARPKMPSLAAEPADPQRTKLVEALQKIAGGHISNGGTLVVNGDWKGFVEALQTIARAALAGEEPK